MPPLTAHRATIAGIGSTAALLAAVIAVSLIVGGLVAYTASPDGPLATAEPALSLPKRATVTADRANDLALVVPASATRTATPPGAPSTVRAAATGGTTSPPTTATQVAGAPGTAKSSAGRRPTATASVPPTSTATAATTTGSPGPTPAAVPLNHLTTALADTTNAAGAGLGGTLQNSVGGLGKVVAQILPVLGPTLQKAAEGANAAITGTTDTLANIVRGLGGAPPPPKP